MLALNKFKTIKTTKTTKFHTSTIQCSMNIFDWMVNDKVNTIINEQDKTNENINKLYAQLILLIKTQNEMLKLMSVDKEYIDYIKIQNEFIIEQNDLILKQNEAIIAKLNNE